MTTAFENQHDISYTDVAEQFLRMCRNGGTPSIREFAETYPQFAEEICEEFPVMLLAERLRGPIPVRSESEPMPKEIAGYRIVSELGRGGMGRVFLAHHGVWKKEVAIKVISFKDNVKPGLVARFRREARASGNLKHANIVTVLDYGTEADYAYIVMPRIKGQTLVRVIEEIAKTADSQGTDHVNIDWTLLADIGHQVTSALEYAHERGLVHRDIKPGNLMVDPRGKVWVMDFGLVKVSESQESLSSTGNLIGTPRYMAPEQFRGYCDARSDIYGLGLTLYEMACGKRVWDFLSSEQFYRNRLHLTLPPVREINPNIPEALEHIIMKCCEFDPENRYQNASELKFVLERYLSGIARSDRRRMKNRQRVWYKRKTLMAGTALASCLSLGCLGYGAFELFKPRNPFEDPQSAIKVLQDRDVRTEFIKELPGLIEEVVTSDNPEFREVMGNLTKRSLHETIDSYDIAGEEKQKIKKNIEKWVNSYQRGDLSGSQLGAVWNNMVDSSVATAMRFNRIYVQVFHSKMDQDEKQRAEQWMILLRQAVVENRLSQEAIGRLMDKIAELEKKHEPTDDAINYPPLDIEELREFLVCVRRELEAVGGYVRDVAVAPQDVKVAEKIQSTIESALKDPQIREFMQGKHPNGSAPNINLQKIMNENFPMEHGVSK